MFDNISCSIPIFNWKKVVCTAYSRL